MAGGGAHVHGYVRGVGVEACAAKTCMQWLHKQAVHKLLSIVRTRRDLEHTPP